VTEQQQEYARARLDAVDANGPTYGCEIVFDSGCDCAQFCKTHNREACFACPEGVRLVAADLSLALDALDRVRKVLDAHSFHDTECFLVGADCVLVSYVRAALNGGPTT
jgi:hypothetical protein